MYSTGRIYNINLIILDAMQNDYFKTELVFKAYSCLKKYECPRDPRQIIRQIFFLIKYDLIIHYGGFHSYSVSIKYNIHYSKDKTNI